MIDKLLFWDKELFLVLNSLNSQWFDLIMFYLTKTETWIPLYLTLLFFIFREYKKNGWFILLGITLTVFLSDRITSGFFKPYFHRLRPSHEPELSGLVHIVNQYQGGMYGFVSSHAANTFGTAMFIYLLFRYRYKPIFWIFSWAGIVSYTRIYLGVHYPLDVLLGAMIGMLCGMVGFWVCKKLITKIYETTELPF